MIRLVGLRWSPMFAALIVLAVSAGCGVGTGAGHGGTAVGDFVAEAGALSTLGDLSGTWTASPAHNDPPEVSGCTGDLTPMELCGHFVLDLEQSDETFEGAGVGDYCDKALGIAGVIEATVFAGSLTGTDLDAVYRTTFTGVVDGDSATIRPTSIVREGVDGSCSLRGTYVLAR